MSKLIARSFYFGIFAILRTNKVVKSLRLDRGISLTCHHSMSKFLFHKFIGPREEEMRDHILIFQLANVRLRADDIERQISGCLFLSDMRSWSSILIYLSLLALLLLNQISSFHLSILSDQSPLSILVSSLPDYLTFSSHFIVLISQIISIK